MRSGTTEASHVEVERALTDAEFLRRRVQVDLSTGDVGTQKRLFRALTRAILSWEGPLPAPSKKVAVITPLSDRPDLLPTEQVSLRHLIKFLGRYDRYIIAPEGVPLNFDVSGFQVKRFDQKFFGSAASHNLLTYWPKYYRTFAEYEYILIYHLDSLVFSDQLLDWCGRGFDYIGAPWLPCKDTPGIKEPGVGNGGFTLMRVGATLEVFRNRYQQMPSRFWEDWLVRRYFKRITSSNGLSGRTNGLQERMISRLQQTETLTLPNDLFWGIQAPELCPGFKIPDWKTALAFAFETVPDECLKLNEGRLPFGCHAWARYNRAFWEPYLLPA